MKTKYEFYCHINTHPATCVNCHVTYKTWKKLEEHEDYCTRRFGRTILSVDPRLEQQREKMREKKKKYPFKCILCKRRYVKHEHLHDHQVKRCEKRFASKQWVIKIWVTYIHNNESRQNRNIIMWNQINVLLKFKYSVRLLILPKYFSRAQSQRRIESDQATNMITVDIHY